jgi:hypothetical protein
MRPVVISGTVALALNEPDIVQIIEPSSRLTPEEGKV